MLRFAAGLAQNDTYLSDAHVDNTRGDEPAQQWRNFQASFALTMGGQPINFQAMRQTTYESMSRNMRAEKGVEDYIRGALENGVHPGPALVGNGISIDVTSPQGTFQGYTVTVRTRAPANVQEDDETHARNGYMAWGVADVRAYSGPTTEARL